MNRMSESMRTVLLPLPYDVRSFVCEDENGEPTCYLNSRLSYEMNKKSFEHEREHKSHDDLNREIDVNRIEIFRHRR